MLCKFRQGAFGELTLSSPQSPKTSPYRTNQPFSRTEYPLVPTASMCTCSLTSSHRLVSSSHQALQPHRRRNLLGHTTRPSCRAQKQRSCETVSLRDKCDTIARQVGSNEGLLSSQRERNRIAGHGCCRIKVVLCRFCSGRAFFPSISFPSCHGSLRYKFLWAVR